MVSTVSFKNIGDELSDDDLNAIVSLLRNNKTLSEDITVKNSEVTGEYGKYIFNLQSTTVVDNGILITDETLTNLGTVKLTNPTFHNATYTLFLTVFSMEDVNIMADENTSEINITTLEIELINDTAVNIPFETLNYSCIVSFNASLIIKQDKPVINGAYVTGLDISAIPNIIQDSETSVVKIKATDLDSLGVPDKKIILSRDNYPKIYYDPCTSDTTNNYYVITTSGNSVGFNNNTIIYTVGSSNKSIGYDTVNTSIAISDYLGKKVRFTVDVNPSNQCRIVIAQLIDGSWSNVSSDYVSSPTTLSLDAEISENATRLAFRIDCSAGSSGDTVGINNWTIRDMSDVELTTDGNGECTYGYEGTGIGVVNFQAHHGSMISSETSEVLDAVKWDKGILDDAGTHDIYDVRNTNRDVFTRTNEYSSLTEKVSDTTAQLWISNIPNGCVVDLEIMQVDGEYSTNIFVISNNSTYLAGFRLSWIGYSSSVVGQWIKLRIDLRTEGYFTVTDLEDDTKTYTKANAFTGRANRVGFLTAGECTEIRIRNVKVYPMEV